MPTYNAVLFDIDDTLVKTWQAKWAQHKWVAKHYYGVDLTDATLREFWGMPFDDMAAILYQNEGTVQDRRANFSRHELEFAKQYQPDTLAVLNTLHAAGMTMGYLTSMYMAGAMIDLENLKMPLDYFVVQQAADHTEFHKPDPRVFTPALVTLAGRGITDGVLYVGDALTDFAAARDAGLGFVGVTTGFVTEQDFKNAGATTVIDSLAKLPALVVAQAS